MVVAQRRSTIALADEVIHLDAGRVIGRGRHEELLASSPRYAALLTAYEAAARAAGALPEPAVRESAVRESEPALPEPAVPEHVRELEPEAAP